VIQRLSSNILIRAIVLMVAIIIAIAPVMALWVGCGETKTTDTFTELLGLVPAEAADIKAPGYFILIDYTSFYKDNGITFTTFEELLTEIKKKPSEILKNIPGEGSYITGYGKYAEHSTIREKYVGYDIGDVDAEIQFGVPPAEGVAAIGRFDLEATEKALGNQVEWPPEIKGRYQIEKYNGVTIHSWGDGFQINLSARLSPPHLDELGRAKPLAVTDKYLFYHPSGEIIKQMIDASQKKGGSVADLPEYATIISHLAKYSIYSVILGNAAMANYFVSSLKDSSNQLPEDKKAIQIAGLGAPLKRFVTFGSGSGSDEKGYFTVLIIYHDNSYYARENVTLFRQRLESQASLTSNKPWTELIKEYEIKADDLLMIAKLYTGTPALQSTSIFLQDSLLYHEE
jgi:hypothetical protein